VQRRCLRFATNLDAGHTLTRSDLVSLRPAPVGSVEPFEIELFIGLQIREAVTKHEVLTKDLF
jgi:sialic acid synthase SpsE